MTATDDTDAHAEDQTPRSVEPQSVVNIPGADLNTPLGELTVRQFVLLLEQVDRQLPKRTGLPQDAAATLQAIQAVMAGAQRGRGNELTEAVRQAQLAILKEMPAIIKQSRQLVPEEREGDK